MTEAEMKDRALNDWISWSQQIVREYVSGELLPSQVAQIYNNLEYGQREAFDYKVAEHHLHIADQLQNNSFAHMRIARQMKEDAAKPKIKML